MQQVTQHKVEPFSSPSAQVDILKVVVGEQGVSECLFCFQRLEARKRDRQVLVATFARVEVALIESSILPPLPCVEAWPGQGWTPVH